MKLEDYDNFNKNLLIFTFFCVGLAINFIINYGFSGFFVDRYNHSNCYTDYLCMDQDTFNSGGRKLPTNVNDILTDLYDNFTSIPNVSYKTTKLQPSSGVQLLEYTNVNPPNSTRTDNSGTTSYTGLNITDSNTSKPVSLFYNSFYNTYNNIIFPQP